MDITDKQIEELAMQDKYWGKLNNFNWEQFGRDLVNLTNKHLAEQKSSESITIFIEDYEKLQSIKVAACIYVREEVDWKDFGLLDDINDDKAMEWFVNEYSEHNYG